MQVKEESIAVNYHRILRKVSNITTSLHTIRIALKHQGLFSTLKKNKPLHLDRHKQIRHEWAKKHKDCTKEQWKKVVFLDESKFNIVGV